MVYDFDVHHGNGTNDLFHEDTSVLFVSTHQQGIYPGTGKISDVGSGDGEGYTINLPLYGAHCLSKAHGQWCPRESGWEHQRYAWKPCCPGMTCAYPLQPVQAK